uniref:serine protease inhibitor Kazal-type 6-like n=1 Tax=Podarcis muralis TaxID=64176 RepID=UPI00109F34BE|nr:serine protease inhibitor Kazal-type 6-like [Podarcis muralis]
MCDRLFKTMKFASAFVLLALILCCFSGSTAKETKRSCIINPKEDYFVCPPVESFVCGSDGKTYKNTCFLGKAMRASCGKVRYRHPGPCTP